MSCPPPDRLLGFASGELSDDQSAGLEEHIDGCSECRAVLSNMARGGPPPSFGRYRIDTVLGSGGMGIVYRGFDPQLARSVAIKVVRRAGEDTAGRARLVREAQALARLSHPHVCHVYDVGTEGDEVWLAMELIDGVSLRQWAGESRSRDEIVAVLVGAAEGIAAAHAAGLVHRDIKPENVLVTRDGRAIVTDFGLARHEDKIDPNASTLSTDPHLTMTGAIAGTPAYLAPEQLLGDPIDARVDQFAWAVMAWELITSTKPFPIVFAVRVEAIRAGVTPPPNLPRHLAAALSRAMSAAPADRFPSMRELIDAIRQPHPFVPKRGRGAAVAGLAVLGASAIAVTAWQWQRGGDKPSAPAVAKLTPPEPATPDAQPEAKVEATPDARVEAKVDVAPAAIAMPAPAPGQKPTQPKTKKMQASQPPLPAPAPAPPQAAVTITPQQAAMLDSMQRKYCRSCQIAVVDAFCNIPYDFAKPNTTWKSQVVDWGTVSKLEVETGTFRDETIHSNVITLRGQRGTYRFDDDFLDTKLTTKVGALLAVCLEGDSDLYQLSGGPTNITRAVITLSAPPRLETAAKLKAQHIPDIKLAAASLRGTLDGLDPNGRYLIHAKVDSIDGAWYLMDRYWLEVPKGIKGEAKIVPKARLWMVVERPEFVDDGTGTGKKRLVVRAAAVLDDLFP